jgi:hypothetical protein
MVHENASTAARRGTSIIPLDTDGDDWLDRTDMV